MLKKLFSFSNATLFVALILSTIAAWYSIIGLTAIFAGAVVPIIIMGSALELAKITTTVWLRKYWTRSGILLKLYLIPAVVALALLTSMGIFGFLSKAHMDQGVGSGEVSAKIALFDEKIKTQRENIGSAREMLSQMDAQVNNVMNKGDSERSAERSVQIRRQQAKERGSLQKEIETANSVIAKLNEERAPIASEMRKVEAEVGPIKYIAALLYGDDQDANTLERAVRWVIILLVIVFDPLAIMLVLAANASKEWDKEEDDAAKAPEDKLKVDPIVAPIEPILIVPPIEDPQVETEVIPEVITVVEVAPAIEIASTIEEDEEFNRLSSKVVESVVVVEPKIEPTIEEQMADTVDIDPVVVQPVIDTSTDSEFEGVRDPVTDEWIQTGPVFEPSPAVSTFKEVGGGYVEFEGKKMSKRVLQTLRPDLFTLKEDNPREIEVGFGNTLPSAAKMGDTFVKTDHTPHMVYKNNGTKWIEINKLTTGSYLTNTTYLQFLMEKISTGEYDPEMLTDHEQDAITSHIKN